MMSDHRDAADAIRRILSDHHAIEIPHTDADLVDSGLIDSLTLVDLLVQLERAFSITVVMDELDIEDFRSVTRIAAYVTRCRESADASCA